MVQAGARFTGGRQRAQGQVALGGFRSPALVGVDFYYAGVRPFQLALGCNYPSQLSRISLDLREILFGVTSECPCLRSSAACHVHAAAAMVSKRFGLLRLQLRDDD